MTNSTMSATWRRCVARACLFRDELLHVDDVVALPVRGGVTELASLRHTRPIVWRVRSALRNDKINGDLQISKVENNLDGTCNGLADTRTSQQRSINHQTVCRSNILEMLASFNFRIAIRTLQPPISHQSKPTIDEMRR